MDWTTSRADRIKELDAAYAAAVYALEQVSKHIERYKKGRSGAVSAIEEWADDLGGEALAINDSLPQVRRRRCAKCGELREQEDFARSSGWCWGCVAHHHDTRLLVELRKRLTELDAKGEEAGARVLRGRIREMEEYERRAQA